MLILLLLFSEHVLQVTVHFLQFRLAYVAPESRVAGSGDLVDDPSMIAWNYFSKYFLIDLPVALPMPQVLH